MLFVPQTSHRWKPYSQTNTYSSRLAWWRHQMEAFSALLALSAGNSLVTCEFPSQRPVTRNFDVFFDLRLNKRLSKQSWGWWFETPSRSLWRHRYGLPKHTSEVTARTARFMGRTWVPPGADRTQVGLMLARWTLLSGSFRSIFIRW